LKLPLTRNHNSYAYSQIRYLSLPIPQALALFTVVLPLITGISTQGVYGLIQRASKKEQYQLTIPLIAVIGFQLMYETIIATLALAHIVPPSSLNCHLDSRWTRLYRLHDGRAIRTIQDSFECCGLNSVADRAFPFGSPSTCAAVYDRTKNCFGKWRQAEQINAGLLLLVAVIVFILKVFHLIFHPSLEVSSTLTMESSFRSSLSSTVLHGTTQDLVPHANGSEVPLLRMGRKITEGQ